MVDAADLKSVSSNGVRVQVPPRALFCIKVKMLVNQKIWACFLTAIGLVL